LEQREERDRKEREEQRKSDLLVAANKTKKEKERLVYQAIEAVCRA
jgi:hypothetical protein